MDYVIGILLVIAGLFLIVAILLQSSKDSKLSSSIAGGAAETFFGKNKAKTIDKKLNALTIIVVVCFMVLVIVAYILQSGRAKVDYGGDLDLGSDIVTTTSDTTAPTTTTVGDTTTADPATTTTADPATTTTAGA